MPELPEVETTRLGLIPKIRGECIEKVLVRNGRLRWPVPKNLPKVLTGQTVHEIDRRGKYLLWDCGTGFLLCHLGMSGSLRVLPKWQVPETHDHIDITFDNSTVVRYTDPRRFGAMLWIAGRHASHPLLDSLGPEPLSGAFDGAHLFAWSRGRSVSVKEFIMNGQIVVGVGNIYAAESLFLAGIHPSRAAGRLSRVRYERLAAAIKKTLANAIAAGGSSLRNYVQADGEPGYFQLNTFVYDCEGKPCRVCKTPIRSMRHGQRSTYYCPSCQK